MNTEFRFVALADGVGAIEQAPAATGVSNCGILRAGDEAVLIDALLIPRLAARACQAGALECHAVRHVLLTHGHVDHVGGLAAFADTRVWATPGTSRAVAALPGHLELCASWMPAWAEELRRLPVVAPDRTLTAGEWVEQPGGHGITVFDLGRAHSEDDIAVIVDGAGVLFAGDLAFFGITPLLLPGGSLPSWVAALERLAQLPARRIVPGHGPVGGPRELGELRRYLETVLRYAEDSVSAGLPVEEAVSRLPASGWAAGWFEPRRTAINLFSAYLELGPKTGPSPVVEVEPVFRTLHQLLDATAAPRSTE
jgi:cyclase